MQIYHYKTAFACLQIVASDEALYKIQYIDQVDEAMTTTESPFIKRVVQQLEEYFDNKRTTFDVPLVLEGTKFQKQVWRALTQIPYGATVSYQEVAASIGNIKAVRAVGGANNKNPISIIVPCHRVIGKNGQMVGYGGGLDKKIWLLEHEKKVGSKYAKTKS